MACPDCHRRSTLLAALAPAIERHTPLTRQALLGLLAIKDDAQLCRAAKGPNPSKLRHKAERPPAPGAQAPDGLARRTGAPPAAEATTPRELARRTAPPHTAGNTPKATCRHDDTYPAALAQLDSAPAVLHTSCDTTRLTQLLAGPTVAIVGDRNHTSYGHQVTFSLARAQSSPSSHQASNHPAGGASSPASASSPRSPTPR